MDQHAGITRTDDPAPARRSPADLRSPAHHERRSANRYGDRARAGERMGRDELGEVLNFDDEHIVGVLDFLGNLGVIETIGNDAALTEAAALAALTSI